MKKENETLEHTKRNIVSFQNLKKKHLRKFNKYPAHQHRPLLKTLEVKGLRRVQEVSKIFMTTQRPYHHKELKIFMRKLPELKVPHYYVFQQIMNQETVKKLRKIRNGEMQWT
jgi:hypothetical protein